MFVVYLNFNFVPIDQKCAFILMFLSSGSSFRVFCLFYRAFARIIVSIQLSNNKNYPATSLLLIQFAPFLSHTKSTEP